MNEQEKTVVSRKGKRGPAPTGKGTPIMVRLQPDLLAWVDAQRARLDPAPSRPEFIRHVLAGDHFVWLAKQIRAGNPAPGSSGDQQATLYERIAHDLAEAISATDAPRRTP